MIRALAAAAIAISAAAASAQTAEERKAAPAPTPAAIPEIPAGADPMDRKPDPAAGSPAAAGTLPQPAGIGDGNATCHVRRADTDTGFVVVCEEGS